MKNINVGVANLIISEKLKNSYFDNLLVEESKKTAIDFLDILKNSPILQLEFKVFNNIENKHIESDIIATRYIDNNIKLFEVYTIDEIDKEREKMLGIINESEITINDNLKDKYSLYKAIDTLIRESICDYNQVNVDDIHDSFSLVLNHIKTNKKSIVENTDPDLDIINDEIIEIAIDKFNEKYESLNEEELNLIKKLVDLGDTEKFKLFETYKIETIQLLEGLKENEPSENIDRAINKINNMIYESYNPQIDDDIINLYELKKELL